MESSMIGQGIKTAAKKVGTFFKKTGAVIAKFALKVVATVQKVASKIVKYIPVIGKPLSKALGASSSAWNAASNAIHAKLPKKLEKGTKVMDTVRTVAGFVPRDALSFEEPDMRELVERDVYGVYLDSREYDYYDDE
ncbi:hypothetical protein BDZ97DRAFT_1311929 [Flammula alnicola]|nr:hypothetical protein BDZ97DRAFT_1311929 [Flammula alnicola]